MKVAEYTAVLYPLRTETIWYYVSQCL